MEERPVEKMLHPGSMHQYCEYAGRYGFTPYDYESDFDQEAFLRQWNEIRRYVKKESSYQHIRTRYPDVLLNPKGTARISICTGENAVYPLVHDLAPGFQKTGMEMNLPVYAPGWRIYGGIYTAPKKGMKRMEEKTAVKYLEWSQKRFGLFDILMRKKQHLDVLLPDDADATGSAAAIALRDYKTRKLHLAITLTYCDTADYDHSDCVKYDYIIFHELSHLLYCLRYDTESSDKIVPEFVDHFCGRCLPGYKKLDQTGKHEIAVDFLTEGMLTGTEYEDLFCPHKHYTNFTEIASRFFEQFIAEI